MKQVELYGRKHQDCIKNIHGYTGTLRFTTLDFIVLHRCCFLQVEGLWHPCLSVPFFQQHLLT